MKATARILASAALALVLSVPAFAEANIVVINVDGANEGFNDPTPAAPVGGNSGTTLGQQRQIAFLHAADIWASTIDSNVTIYVTAAFNPLAANILGSAGATFVFSDYGSTGYFPGPAFADTWYSSALADKRAGADLNPGFADLNAQFNSNVNFYLGLDANHGAQSDLVTVLLHELGHGLGFQNFVNESTGSNLAGRTDVYSRFTLDISNGLLWSDMTQAQRAASAIRWSQVAWNGPTVTAAASSVLLPGSPIVRVTAPAAVARDYQFGTAAFGAPLGTSTVTGPVTYIGLACAPVPAGSLSGQIALADRGVCGFVNKAAFAQAGGAIGLIIANNTAGGPPGMAGVDPSVTITTVSVNQSDGNALKANLAGLNATLTFDPTVLAGATPSGFVRIYAPSVVEGGSSGSHYDSIARRNLLMEPAINGDLTHSLIPPQDLTLPLMRDIGWFADADVDGVEDDADDCDDSIFSATVVIDGCDTGVANTHLASGCTLSDKVAECAADAKNHGAFVSCVSALANAWSKDGTIAAGDKSALQTCAAQSSIGN